MEEAPLKKQITYAGFYPRVFASLIDLLLSSLVLIPVFVIFSSLIYGHTPPAAVLGPVTNEVVAQMQKSGNSSITDAFSSIMNDPRVHNYFITEGGIFRVLADQLFQLLGFGIVLIMFWRYRSATPGKMLLSMKIVDAKTYGKLTRKQEIIRFLGYIVAVLPLCLGFLWIAFDKKKQGFHDKLAGSVVIKA
jgi:uncharacterized RDD family membrane protein YckC